MTDYKSSLFGLIHASLLYHGPAPHSSPLPWPRPTLLPSIMAPPHAPSPLSWPRPTLLPSIMAPPHAPPLYHGPTPCSSPLSCPPPPPPHAPPLCHEQVLLYVDLHGHSRKQNIFNYGCHDKDCDHTQFLNERVFCFLLSQLVGHMAMSLVVVEVQSKTMCVYVYMCVSICVCVCMCVTPSPPPPPPLLFPSLSFSSPSPLLPSPLPSRHQTNFHIQVASFQFGSPNGEQVESWCGRWVWPTVSQWRLASVAPPSGTMVTSCVLCSHHSSTPSPQTGNQVDHFTTDDLLSMGRSLCEAIQKYHHFINSTRCGCGLFSP